ncbi:hypothetical protein [Mesorhizobium sp. L2C066B000]|uniref:hypothetical protein n=1 Tax=Mesorhizobium sp. L2C066B000 TaxID=1287105 RepID=UPI0012DE287E|nr:hypothetical protein [Mesorhizobium sp. L2C066B000]
MDFKVGDPVLAQVFSGDFADQVDAAAGATVFNAVFVAVSIRSDVKAGHRVVAKGATGSVGAAAVELAPISTPMRSTWSPLRRRRNWCPALMGRRSSLPRMTDQRWTLPKRRCAAPGAAATAGRMSSSTWCAARCFGGLTARARLCGQARHGLLRLGRHPSRQANHRLYENLTVMGAPLNIYFDGH